MASQSRGRSGRGRNGRGGRGGNVPTPTAVLEPPGRDQTTNEGTKALDLASTRNIVTPAFPGYAPTPEYQATVGANANLLLQYITSIAPRIAMQFGTPSGWRQGAGIHVLPIYIDELERDFGIDMYLRMMNDATVKSVDGTLRASILDKPIQVLSCIDEDSEKYKGQKRKVKFAQDVADFVAANFEQLPGGMDKLCYELLEGIPLGYKLAEMVFEVREVIPGKGPQTALAGIHPKPQEAVSIVADMYNTVLGYMPRLQGSGLVGGFMFGELGLRTTETSEEIDIPGLVPPEKVLRFTWMERNDNPVGVSHLRSGYIPWRMKVGLYPAWEAFLVRFAQPGVTVELQGQDLPPVMGGDGKMTNDPVKILQAILTSISNYQGGGGMVLPVGTLNVSEVASEGEAYLRAFEYVDEQITLGYLYANLATQGGKYGTQALGEVHQDTKGLLVSLGKQHLVRVLKEGIAKLLVLINYGKDALWATPNISVGETEQQDFSTTATAISSLKGVDLIFPQQINAIMKMLHLPPLPEEVIQTLTDIWEAQRESDLQAAQVPVGPDGQPLQQPGMGPDGQGGPGGQGDGQDPNAPENQPDGGNGGPGNLW